MELAKRFSAHHRPEQPIEATVRSALGMASEFAAASGLDASAAARLAVVVDELVGNLLRHGRPACDVHIELTLSRAEGESDVLLMLEDDCLPFDPREVRFTGPDGDSGGGVGLALVRAFAHIDAYEQHDGLNRLTLRLPRPAGAA